MKTYRVSYWSGDTLYTDEIEAECEADVIDKVYEDVYWPIIVEIEEY